MQNPFHATFGVSPPLLVGRDAVIADFVDAIEDGPGSAGRATLYTGARGTGKTVMLNAVEVRARDLGWSVISETASEGFVSRIVEEHLPRLLREFDPEVVRRHLSGITAPFSLGGADWTVNETHEARPGLRNQIELLTDLLSERDGGLLITLDEIHHSRIRELRELATTVQHAFREERNLAFVGAGLAASISDVVNDEVLTFFRRADRHALDLLGRDAVARGFAVPIHEAGRRVDDEALEMMIDGARGYPFLIQLIGAHAWRVDPDAEEITARAAAIGVAESRRRLGRLLHEPALRTTTDVGRAFLRAMAEDDGPSSMADLQQRLGVSSGYASQYRLRLIAAELIHPGGYGYVDFTIPYLREYLREESAAIR